MKKRYIIALIIALIILGLTYKFWLIFKTATSARFDFYPFCIILVLSYLGGLKLTDYLADFKDIKHQSRIEIIFLLVFFTFLFIPMSHINDSVYSQKERRRLAEYKPLFQEHQKVNYNFGNDFNNWYNDRFNFRDILINAYQHTRIYLSVYARVKWLVWIKENNWILKESWDETIFEKQPYDSMNSNLWEYFNNLQSFCDEQNIKLYIVISPTRERLYIDKFLYAKHSPEDYIQEIHYKGLNILYPYKELLDASKKDYVYFKTDHHWTDYGAYIICNLILKNINKDFPTVKLIDKNDYNISFSKKVKSEFEREYNEGVEIAYFAPFLKKYAHKILDTEYLYYTHKNETLLKIKVYNNKRLKGRDYEYPSGNNIKVLQIGTSMNENLLDFMPYQFMSLKYIRLNGPQGRNEKEQYKIFKYYKDDIIQYKPNIMIFCIEAYQTTDISRYGE